MSDKRRQRDKNRVRNYASKFIYVSSCIEAYITDFLQQMFGPKFEEIHYKV